MISDSFSCAVAVILVLSSTNAAEFDRSVSGEQVSSKCPPYNSIFNYTGYSQRVTLGKGRLVSLGAFYSQCISSR